MGSDRNQNRVASGLFTLEIDAILFFNPPMSEKAAGIAITNTLQIPFAPFDGLSIVSRIFGEPPMPEGAQLKEVTWDAEREVFMAYTEHVFCDFPILSIPQEIGFWLDLGWKFGSYADKYDPPQRGRKPKEAKLLRSSWPSRQPRGTGSGRSQSFALL
jgi:hypothetical protein